MPPATTKTPKTKTKPSFTTLCPACQATVSHELVHRGRFGHLKCGACGSIGVYELECDKSEAIHAATAVDLGRVLAERGEAAVRTYRATESFAAGEYVGHPTFAEGYVLGLLYPPTKMEVLFSERRRVLACVPPPVVEAPPPPPRAPREEVRPAPRTVRSDDARDDDRPRSTSSSSRPATEKPVTCPRCGKTVHPFNLARTVDDRILGCMYCR